MPLVFVQRYAPATAELDISHAYVVSGTLTFPVGGTKVVLDSATFTSPGPYAIFIYGTCSTFANLVEGDITVSGGALTVKPGSLTNDTVNKYITVELQ